MISADNMLLSIWKVFVVLLSLTSPFQYVYYAAFIHKLTDAEREEWSVIDWSYQVIFIVDFVL